MSRAGVKIPKIVKQGHLKTSCDTRINMKTRLVVLGEKRIAFYDDSEKEITIKDEFYLRRKSVAEEVDDTTFRIVLYGDKVYFFALCKGEKLKDWVNSINSVIAELRLIPNTHYFIPNLKPIKKQASDFKIPTGFPRILMESMLHKKICNEEANNDVFRPEDLIEWVDETSLYGMFNPVRHVKVPEYKCRPHPWGKGVSLFLKFDLLLSEYIKKATTHIRALIQSRGQKITERPDKEEMDELFSSICSMFSSASSEFEDHPSDSVADELGLAYLWIDTQPGSELENEWKNWITRYFSFCAIAENYISNGIDYSILIASKYDDAIQHFIELKDKCVKQIQEGISFTDFCLQKARILDLFFPDIKAWPQFLTNFNQEMPIFMPNSFYMMMKCIVKSILPLDYLEKKDENLEVFHYYEFIFEKHNIFISKLLQETKNYIIEVTAAIAPVPHVAAIIDSFAMIEPSLTQEEIKELRDKVSAITNK